jgi:hypothetical protein
MVCSIPSEGLPQQGLKFHHPTALNPQLLIVSILSHLHICIVLLLKPTYAVSRLIGNGEARAWRPWHPETDCDSFSDQVSLFLFFTYILHSRLE